MKKTQNFLLILFVAISSFTGYAQAETATTTVLEKKTQRFVSKSGDNPNK